MKSKEKKTHPFLFRKKSKLLSAVCKCGLAIILFVMTGCGASKKINTNILYFQTDLDSLATITPKENIIKNNDLLNIQIFSKSLIQDQATIFNLPDKNVTVGNDGTIAMPILGNIKATGLTKIQLQTSIEGKLTNYIKDPTVIVKFGQFNVNVLGEVRSPGTHSFQSDRVTLIDAISAAGDLTDEGKREDVTIIREVNFERKIYKIDLRSGTAFMSPAFQMEPNDIIYVGANVKKLRHLNTGPDRPNGLQTTSSVLSIISTLTFLIFTFYKK